MERLEGWLDEHLPARLVGAWYWCRQRLTGARCFACGMPLLLHTPAQAWRCNNAPLEGLEVTEQGMAQVVVAEAEQIAGDAA